jgi:hypothetical protein
MGKRAHVATLSVGVTTSTQLDLDDDREDGLAVDEEHDEVRAILRGHDIGEVGGLDWSRRPYAMLVHDPRDSLSASAVPRSAKVTHPPAGV